MLGKAQLEEPGLHLGEMLHTLGVLGVAPVHADLKGEGGENQEGELTLSRMGSRRD